MVWVRQFGMIASVTSMNQLGNSLPADIFPALLALSLRRKLRGGYDGQFFRFRNESGEFDYPENPVTPNSHLVKIYDQSGRLNDAEQSDQESQPEVVVNAGEPHVQFSRGKFLSVPSVANEVGNNFVITAIGDGDFPRPMVSMEGTSDTVTIEPGEPTKFRFNDKTAISRNSANRVNQYASLVSESQNRDQVLTIKTDGGEDGQSLGVSTTPSFDTFSIGKTSERDFEGKFIEVMVHKEPSKYAANKIWEDACLNY